MAPEEIERALARFESLRLMDGAVVQHRLSYGNVVITVTHTLGKPSPRRSSAELSYPKDRGIDLDGQPHGIPAASLGRRPRQFACLVYWPTSLMPCTTFRKTRASSVDRSMTLTVTSVLHTHNP